MEGLEIQEYKLSDCIQNKDYRIDTDYYIKIPNKNKNLEYKKIGECLLYSQYGISIEMNEENKGYPIYRMNEIHDMLCDLNVDKCADIEEDVFESFQLNDKDVLFNRTNSYDFVGRTGIYYDNDGVKRTFASYLVKFVPKTYIILPEYLTTYLNTEQGILDIKRHARQSINQTNVNPEEVKEMEIPILSMYLQEKIKDNLILANKKRCHAQVLYLDAQKLLLDYLNLNDWQPSNNQINVKSLKDSFMLSGRMDSEYYQAKYDELDRMISTLPHKKLKDLCILINHGMQPPYVENGEMRVFSQKWIKDNEIDYSFVEDSNEPRTNIEFAYANPEYVCKKNDIVHYSVGANIGFCHTYLSDVPMMPGSFITLIRANENKINPIYLGVVLNSIVGRMQSEKRKSGTAQPYIYPKDLKEFIIPILANNVQESIASKVQESFALKSESKRLLNAAKKAVEIAISENEEKALQYITENENG